MTDITLSGKLPGGDCNGLAKIASDLVKNPGKVHAIIALIDTSKTVTNTDTGDSYPVVRIRRVECVMKDDLAMGERLMRRALEERTGQTMLDMDLEDELEAAFKDIESDVEDK